MPGQATILVVDDEPNNFDVIEMLLLNEGYTLDYAASGLGALTYLDGQQPDTILLDVMMPGINGIEVCKKIKDNPKWKHIPVIMATALNAKEDIARCLDAGADDFISKPLNGIELRARIRSMLRIKRHYDSLQSTLQLREDMSNMVVHDLRNPLGSIILACTILRLGELQEKQQQKVEQIEIAGKQLQSLIDSLLIMAKLESGTLVLNRTGVDPCAIALSVISDLEAIAAQKHINLVSHLPSVGNLIEVDIPLFRRVLDNLLSNAIKFSPSGSKVILEMEYAADQQFVVRVVDNGPGVSETARQSIFEKFETGQSVNGVVQTGLGLAFCKMVAVAHGGTISVANNNPRGATFTLCL